MYLRGACNEQFHLWFEAHLFRAARPGPWEVGAELAHERGRSHHLAANNERHGSIPMAVR